MTKFDKLQRKTTDEGPIRDGRRTVVNLSSHTSSDAATQIIAREMNYELAPKLVPKEDIIEAVEASVRHVPQPEAEKIRQETVRVLAHAKHPMQNISEEERHAIKELKNNSQIVVTQADKGNATVVLDTLDYDKWMEDLLSK
ncbi:uncharacterized protein LOC124795669 [Schistocerca piceifrons]|uniref:uncharacterized protein LOC124795669 n=1 Tax=Schistocerca piceifrons TaxID=274613 RepID=UPI001F5FA18E|nr:uncharacterized protein LOC124795669 [Schistocerca piceifrons]